MCYITTYGTRASRQRTEERQRRVADPRARRGPASTRLRYRQADRGAIRRSASIQRRVAVPSALSPGKTRLDRRTLDRKARPAQTPAVPLDRRGTHGAGRAARGLAGLRPRGEPDCRRRGLISIRRVILTEVGPCQVWGA